MNNMSKEEMVDVELRVGKELGQKLHNMKKDELLNALIVQVLRGRVQDDTVESLEKDKEALQNQLTKSWEAIRQARRMVNAAMEMWS